MLELTKSEARLLTLLADGHSPTSAAHVLEISYQVVKNRLRDARMKNRTNTYGLVARMAVENWCSRPERT